MSSKQKKKATYHIGTSGWSYKHWDKVFYPEKLKAQEHLSFYTQFFPTVEINSTFYNTPLETTITNWYAITPKEFLFCVKASQFITHRKRLNNPKESLDYFLGRIAPLKRKLGPILFQLPPSFKANEERLAEFLKLLPKRFRYVFEFRHASWYTESIYHLLKKHKCALCITDLEGTLSPIEVTGDFIYIRLHGPRKAYKGSYSTQKLKVWSKRIKEWNALQKDVYCFFDNDEKAYAVQDALRLIKILENN